MKEPTPYRPVSYLEWNATRRSSSLAVWDDGREITFDELLESVRLDPDYGARRPACPP